MKNTYIGTCFLLMLTLICKISASQAQHKKPNIVLILADDMGYSDLGCFGSQIQTPVLDEMAEKGLKMTHFYNASRCCPTRASLLTGLYQHQAGVAGMMSPKPFPAYQAYLTENSVTIAEALKLNGYSTFMAGKWHVGQAKEHWPRQRGFDRYFGLIDGANGYFGNTPYRPNQTLTIALDNEPYQTGENYYSTNAYTDFAIKFIEEDRKPGKPFFLYLAYQAPHWPLQALPADIAKYKGKFMAGWDVLREQRFEKQKQLGIINKDEKLSPRDPNVPAWKSLSLSEKRTWDDKMAVYAAMITCMDRNIGKLKAKLKALGEEKNTVFMFLSDNGASHENIEGPSFSKRALAAAKIPASDPNSFTAYGFEGANLSNTPFRYFKHWEYEGGTAAPFIAYGPKFISPQLNRQNAHITDIMSTCLALAGADYPKTFDKHKIIPTTGKSLLLLFQNKKWTGQKALYFEHEGNKAVIEGDWKIVSNHPENQWRLYNLANDRTELNDLTKTYPKRVKEMENLFLKWASKVGVVPQDILNKK